MGWRRRDVAGPGEGQAHDARASFITGLINTGVLNTGINGRRSNVARGELPNPQPARPHGVRTAMAIAEANIGIQAAARLPCRVPPSAWDGEPGAASPVQGTA
jgi:hypothetical protein